MYASGARAKYILINSSRQNNFMIIRRAKKKDIDKLSVLFDKYRIFYRQESDIENARSFLRKRMKRKESVIFVAKKEKN